MNVKIFVLCIFLVYGTAFASTVDRKADNFEETYGDVEDEDVQNDDEYGIDSEETDQEPNEITRNEYKNVEMLTKPQTFTAKIGEIVLLPCEVSDPGEGVFVWHKDQTLLYQGDIALNKPANIEKYENGSLKISLTSDDDFGHYYCQHLVSSSQHTSVNHTIIQLLPPKIISLTPENNKTVYKIGESLTLTCRAKGYPAPEISWHTESGERLGATGETLTIPDLKWKNGGQYRCLADNKLKPLAHEAVQINVEHEPVISIEKYYINSDHQSDAELTCTVHAYPSPSVIWRKDGENIVKTDRILLNQKKHNNAIENVLVIRNLLEKDFGKYSCFAKNGLGKNEKTVNLIRTPAIREFIKPDKSNKDVVLTWKVQSKAAIDRHELQYRKKGEQEWQVINPVVTEGSNGTYEVKHPLPGLDAGSYETRVRSRNAHGWSDFSDIMPFEGTKSGSTHKNHHKKHLKAKDTRSDRIPPISTQVPLSTSHVEVVSAPSKTASDNGCSRLMISPILMTFVLFICFHNRQ